MTPELSAALIGAGSATIVVAITHLLQTRATRRERSAEINLRYLNPLRLHCEEVYYRLLEIRKLLQESRRCDWLLYIDSPEDLSGKDAKWYNSEGCYLASSCYFTACLFATVKKVREDIPYLRLRTVDDDTKLLNLIFAVSHAFLQRLGIFYAIQHSIGSEMWRGEGRLASYREFCEYLMEPATRQWLDRLVAFYLDTGRGIRIENLDAALVALRGLGRFIDRAVKGGDSISSRLKAEGITE